MTRQRLGLRPPSAAVQDLTEFSTTLSLPASIDYIATLFHRFTQVLLFKRLVGR